MQGIIISRCIFVRIRNFITYRIAATLQLLVFFFIAVFAFKPKEFMPPEWKTWVANSTPENDIMNWVDKEEWPADAHAYHLAQRWHPHRHWLR